MRERFKESKKIKKFSRNIWSGRVCYASLGPGSALGKKKKKIGVGEGGGKRGSGGGGGLGTRL